MLRLVRRRACSASTGRSNHIAKPDAAAAKAQVEALAGKTPAGANHAAVSKTATKSRPAQSAHSQRTVAFLPQRPPGAAERKDALHLHHRALRRVLALAEGRRPLHRRPSRRGRVPDRRGARPPRQHLVLDRGPLLAGARVRGLSGASAGRDRGVPQPRRGAGRRRPARSTSTTPSSSPRWPRTTRTSRTRPATSPASRSRPASRRSARPTA